MVFPIAAEGYSSKNVKTDPGRNRGRECEVAMSFRIKRAYETPGPDDGFRVLVDRLWPRGVTKDAARIDLWLKEIAPSDELRKWFNHDPAHWTEFQHRYLREIERHPEAIAQLDAATRNGSVTLVYGARDEEHNNAVVLRRFIESRVHRP